MKHAPLSVAIGLVLGAAMLAPASAQTAAAKTEAGSEEAQQLDLVVVTARRREETLKEVPVAVSALSSVQLENTGAKDITALQEQTPNATVQVARGSSSTLISFIRGVGQQDPLWGFEPGVGLYVDDVYIARPQGAVLDVYDVERIEVLRGPQGTLYGRNTIGGAIKYVSKKLGSTPRFEGKLTVGNYGQRDARGTFALPVSDIFSIGGSIASYDRDGFGKNLFTGAENYNRDSLAYRLSAELIPSDNTFFRLAFDRMTDDTNQRAGRRLLSGATPHSEVLPGIYDTWAGGGDKNKVVTEGLSLQAEWYINDFWTLRSITAHRKGDTDPDVIDFDSTPQPSLDIPSYYKDKQTSQELQLQFTGDRVQGVFGGYYLDADAEGAFDTVLGLAGISIGTGGNVQTRSNALFGDFSYDINDKTRVSVGARYSQDKREGTVLRKTFLGVGSTPVMPGGNPNMIALATNTDYSNSRDDSSFTPRVSLSRDFNDQLTGYVSYSQGFKSGGFDMRGDATLYPGTVNGYKPEKVNSYEIGLKGGSSDGRFTFSSAMFYSDYKDQQVTIQAVVVNAAGQPNVASFVDNAGKSTIWGGEFEAAAVFSDRFRAFMGLGYINASFDEYMSFDVTTGGVKDFSDARVFQNTPEWTANVGVTWTLPLASGSVKITPTASFRDDTHMFEVPNALLDQKAYTLYNLNAEWTSDSGHWSVGVSGHNLFGKDYRIGGYVFPGAVFDNTVTAFYGPPRTYAATLTYRY